MRHPHRTKQVEENFQYPQDMNLETPFQNWPCQMHVHAGQILMFQAGKQCKVCLCTAVSQHISSWHQWDQSSKNQGPGFHLALQGSKMQLQRLNNIIKGDGWGVEGIGYLLQTIFGIPHDFQGASRV